VRVLPSDARLPNSRSPFRRRHHRPRHPPLRSPPGISLALSLPPRPCPCCVLPFSAQCPSIVVPSPPLLTQTLLSSTPAPASAVTVEPDDLVRPSLLHVRPPLASHLLSACWVVGWPPLGESMLVAAGTGVPEWPGPTTSWRARPRCRRRRRALRWARALPSPRAFTILS
jgi:hypothetical protein